jgi:aryl-alcohol dehydrogenase-like predicted oxidoreductase
MSSLVLAWTLQQTSNMVLLCGSHKPGQIEENAVAGDILLKAADVSMINEYLSEVV